MFIVIKPHCAGLSTGPSWCQRHRGSNGHCRGGSDESIITPSTGMASGTETRNRDSESESELARGPG
jgi:hypothetical protein